MFQRVWCVETTLLILNIIIITLLWEGEDEEYCRVLGLYNSVGVCVEERQAEWLMKRARAEQREAKLDQAQDSLRPAPLCGQPQWQWQ